MDCNRARRDDWVKPILEAAVSLNEFMHIETFGRSPRQVDGKCWSFAEVLGEAAQAQVAVAGFAEARPPELFFGAAPQSLAAEAQRLATTAVDLAGRKLRGDAPILVAGVASFPVERQIFDRNPIEQDVYGFWGTRVISWLQDTFGMSLKCVVERQEEHRLRLQFFALPSLTDELRLDWRRAHPGLAAKRRAEQAGANKQQQEREYRLAMRRLEDQFQERVLDGLGRDRFGPMGRRVARRERPAEAKTEGLETRANMQGRKREATVAQISAELDVERERNRATQAQLLDALERLAAAERRAQQAEEEAARLRTALERS
jgi:hypothetical protein